MGSRPAHARAPSPVCILLNGGGSLCASSVSGENWSLGADEVEVARSRIPHDVVEAFVPPRARGPNGRHSKEHVTMVRRTRGILGSAARTAGRTAIIAGTATAVAGKVAHGQAQKHGHQAAPPPPAATHAAHPPAAAHAAHGGDDLVSKLQQLADLRTSGVLSEDEFAAAKRKLLG